MLRTLLVAAAAASLTLGCTSSTMTSAGDRAATTPASAPEQPQVHTPTGAAAVLPAVGAVTAAVEVSQALYDHAPVVVMAPDGDLNARLRGASTAVALGAPLLLTAGSANTGEAAAATQELHRLQPSAVLTFGAAAPTTQPGVDVITAPTDDAQLAKLIHADLRPSKKITPDAAVRAVAGLDRAEPALISTEPPTERGPDQTATTRSTTPALPATEPPEPLDDVLLLSSGAPTDLAAVATARAAGADVQFVAGGDPRQDAATIEAVNASHADHVLALGAAFGDAQTLKNRLAVVRTGIQLPGGGQTLFPGRRLVALYGHPGTPSLGVLGEQPVEEAVQLAKDTADQYQPLSDRPVVPAFEIIATVASSAAGGDGDYSSEASPEKLRPWVDAARKAGVYVVLDLQPGTSSFLDQAKIYEALLRQPNVGLALDPEWRLRPGQRHLAQIGSVTAAEVNEVSAWLATLTRDNALPQKLLVLHQFRTSMITARQDLFTSHDELAVLIHADGNGTPGEKLATWDAVRAGAPAGVWWGWKNFYDEDHPTLTPRQTYAITPVPDLVSYQ